ncbi:MAG: ABC transporter substrate-binding protein [Acidimicrobiia bacterium]
MKRLILAVLVFSSLWAGSAATASTNDEEVVLRVGLGQPWTSLNVTAGFEVSVFDIWNLQYATLTDKSAEDFSTIEGLAESWEASNDGQTYTYTLREGLVWSDNTPLTAEDIAWTINTSRDQGWTNHVATTTNLDAVVIDDRTVEITSLVPDPKLPTMDVYIVPKHIWEPIATDAEAVTAYEALEGVGSGPFVIEQYEPEQFVRMRANPNYWQGAPAIDAIVFQIFTNPDAMVAALQASEIDAIHDVPEQSMETLDGDPNIVTIAGYQGGFDELAINGGAAEGQPHPALLDPIVRRAIGMALDKEAVIEDVLNGFGEPATTISPSADPSWVPDIPTDEQISYDVEGANALLDEAGYLDTDGDGVREMPGGGNNIVLRHGVNTDSNTYPAIAELFPGWMEAIGLGVELNNYDGGQLFEVIAAGDYDTFVWGWTPFVDPDPMLSFFTSAEIGNNNDANWADPEYDALYEAQNQELDPERRREIVHEMLRLMYDAAVYYPLYYSPDLQAYRTDRFEGWVRQPADIGPVMFSNTSPSYFLLQPVGGGVGGGISPVVLIVTGVVIVGVIALLLVNAQRKRATADDRE